MFYDYADSGSWTESTYRANESDLAAIKFRQRVALDVSNRTTEMSMLGQKLPMPVALAPTGLTGMQHALRSVPRPPGNCIVGGHVGSAS